MKEERSHANACFGSHASVREACGGWSVDPHYVRLGGHLTQPIDQTMP
jgi:hypothetical protein